MVGRRSQARWSQPAKVQSSAPVVEEKAWSLVAGRGRRHIAPYVGGAVGTGVVVVVEMRGCVVVPIGPVTMPHGRPTSMPPLPVLLRVFPGIFLPFFQFFAPVFICFAALLLVFPPALVVL